MLTTYFAKAFLISTLIIFATIIPVSNAGKKSEYNTCSTPYSCGIVQNVGYPFCDENIPCFCGKSEFSFQCPKGNEYPCLYIGGDQTHAKVININTTTHTMILALEQFFDSSPLLCRSPNMSACFDFLTKSGAYKLSSNNVNTNITLFYGCEKSISENHHNIRTSFQCFYPHDAIPMDGNDKSNFYYGDNFESVYKYKKSCRYSFYVPVLKKELDKFENSKDIGILDVISKGFEMGYVVNFTACSICEKSGGRCGSPHNKSVDGFVCYCSNGAQALKCTKSGINKLIIIGLSVLLIMGIGVLAILFVFLKKKKSLSEVICSCDRDTRKNKNVETFLKKYESISPKRYTYTNIRRMTNNFKDKLGEGGFGSVFKGQLSDGRIVAVKLISKSNSDGEGFLNEVSSIGRTNHVNIVSLLGFCYQGKKIALVYEFMPNGSLEKFIYNGGIGHLLTWKTLFDICIGIARGLDYLHRGCTTRILHFDIKPHNILLDDEFHPKISDFGLARLCPKKESIISMAEARGTIGYIAPEVCCRSLGGASHKSDVYSYGMMVLEMVGARKNTRAHLPNSEESNFPQWINDTLMLTQDNSVEQDITNTNENELKRKMVIVSLWCIQTNPSSRPSMNRVVEMLEGNLDLLQMPSMPSMCSPSTSTLSSELHFSSGFNLDSNVYPTNFSTTR